MKRTIGLLLAAIFAIGVWLPTDSTAQRRYEGITVYRARNNDFWSGRQRRYNNRRYRRTYGYRNYGQYRRTQVGNRRFRLVPRYYYWHGRRLRRMVRIYY